jgi:N-acetylmuramoyl-L-alanine amidase
MWQASDKIKSYSIGRGWILISILGWALLFAFITASAQQKNSGIKTVVIDAGHGGKDPGSVVGRAKEKNIVLDIALKVGKHIKESQKKIKVVYIRDGDYFVPLMDRAQIANKVKADLFISIHANYCSNPSIFGTETYVLGLHRTEDNLNVAKKENSVILLEEDYSSRYEGFNPNLSESYIMFELIQDNYLDQSLRFASELQQNFKKLAQRHDREVRQAGFLVLRETSMPSVLVEVGYLSNKKENSFLMTDQGRSEISYAIYGSIFDYLNLDDAKDNKEFLTNEQKLAVPQVQEIPSASHSPSKIGTVETVIKGGKNLEASGIDQPKVETVTKQKVAANKTTYAIQLGVFNHKVGINSKYFKGITPIKEISFDGKFKYFCSESNTFQATKSDYAKVVRMFPDAFIVSIQNNQTKMVWKNGGSK